MISYDILMVFICFHGIFQYLIPASRSPGCLFSQMRRWLLVASTQLPGGHAALRSLDHRRHRLGRGKLHAEVHIAQHAHWNFHCCWMDRLHPSATFGEDGLLLVGARSHFLGSEPPGAEVCPTQQKRICSRPLRQ